MNNPSTTPPPLQDSRSPAWHTWLWAVSVLLVVLTLSVIGTAWAVKQSLIAPGARLSFSQTRIVLAIADFPTTAYAVFRELLSQDTSVAPDLLFDRRSTEQPNWIRHFPETGDPGYLLLSGVDPSTKQANVRLIRISDGMVVARWNPHWPTIHKKIASNEFMPAVPINRMRAHHPLLLSDGDIVFSMGAMVRVRACSSEPVWVLNEHTHHSIQLDQDGNLWTGSYSQDGLAENAWLQARVRDDALAHLSPDGHLLEKRSFSRILRNNGLQVLLLGHSNFSLTRDPIHLNEIQVALRDSRYWQRGDLLISARHLSTVFLYRPSTDKILWYKTGPWMNQHAVDFVNDHQISVFDNNVISNAPKQHAFMTPGESNRVVLFDFDTRQVSQPYADLLARARPITITEGRARVLPDGGLFIEETNYGRHLRFTQDRLLWSRINDYDDQRIGMVAWSRYLTADEVRTPLQSLAARKCLDETAKQ